MFAPPDAPSTASTEERAQIIDRVRLGGVLVRSIALDPRETQREAEDAPAVFREFARALGEAEAQAELEALRSIERAAAEGDWRARTWLLERRWPDRWGRRTRHEVTGAHGEPIGVQGGALSDLSKLSERELDQLDELLERTHGR